MSVSLLLLHFKLKIRQKSPKIVYRPTGRPCGAPRSSSPLPRRGDEGKEGKEMKGKRRKRRGEKGEKGRGVATGRISVYIPPKSVTVLFTCGTLTHVLKLQ